MKKRNIIGLIVAFILLISNVSAIVDTSQVYTLLDYMTIGGTSDSQKADSNENGNIDQADSLLEPGSTTTIDGIWHPVQQIAIDQISYLSIDENSNGWPDVCDSLTSIGASVPVGIMFDRMWDITKSSTDMTRIDSDTNGWPDKCDCVISELGTDENNCGSCGNLCTGTDPRCCTASCKELDNDILNCGDCGIICSTNHATPGCAGGACSVSCDSDWDDCNSNVDDGCETPLTTTSNCGTCGNTCTNDHGTTTCSSGTCSPTCDAGWSDCDGDPDNGCETSLGTTSNCLSCGDSCGSGESCFGVGCCDSNYGNACGSCGGTTQCDGTCSISTPSNYGQSCGGGFCVSAGTYNCAGTCIGETAITTGSECWSVATGSLSTKPWGTWTASVSAESRISGGVRQVRITGCSGYGGSCTTGWSTDVASCKYFVFDVSQYGCLAISTIMDAVYVMTGNIYDDYPISQDRWIQTTIGPNGGVAGSSTTKNAHYGTCVIENEWPGYGWPTCIKATGASTCSGSATSKSCSCASGYRRLYRRDLFERWVDGNWKRRTHYDCVKN